jgi:hypothetical protein
LGFAGGVSGAANFDISMKQKPWENGTRQPGDDLYVQPLKGFNKIEFTYVWSCRPFKIDVKSERSSVEKG